MPPSTAKRVVLYRWDRPPAEGIIDPSAYLFDNRLEWLSLEGRMQICAFEECKALCFVTEAGKADLFADHNLFERRPKVPGLWTRFTFRDGEVLDGILSHNLLDWPPGGYFIVPPQAKASRQRVFIPRAALSATELRGVVGGSALARGSKETSKHPVGTQLSIFDL